MLGCFYHKYESEIYVERWRQQKDRQREKENVGDLRYRKEERER